MSKKRAMSSERARQVRQKGHDDALEFALKIGLNTDYRNDKQAKKDVIDPSGDAHSVKSGVKRWQLFLYGQHRFENDDFFQTMNGIGQEIIKCIEAFPATYTEYQKNKQEAKERCRIPMRKLKELFQEKRRVKTFINKAMFNGGEVNYLTIKHQNQFHIFLNQDVIQVFSDNVIVQNSQARAKGQTPEQKVIFKYNNKNLAELEIRNSGKNHYKEVLFVMNKLVMLDLLFYYIKDKKEFLEDIFVYNQAIKKFGNWEK